MTTTAPYCHDCGSDYNHIDNVECSDCHASLVIDDRICPICCEPHRDVLVSGYCGRCEPEGYEEYDFEEWVENEYFEA